MKRKASHPSVVSLHRTTQRIGLSASRALFDPNKTPSGKIPKA